MPLLAKAIDYLDKKLSWTSTRARDVGMGVLSAMVLLTVTDVALRRLFNSPLSFSYELTGAMLVLVAFFTVAYTGVQKSHVSIDLLISRFPSKARAIINAFVYFLSICLFGAVTWRSIIYAMNFKHEGYETGILGLPYYPFAFAIAFGSLLLALVLVVRFLSFINEVVSK